MATYYVFSPNIEVTAEVGAPDSRHARTAFLDYLARNGKILYSQRQAVRRQLITKRMQPGEIQTSIQLEYGVREPVTQEVVSPPMQKLPEPSEEIGVGPTYEDLGPVPEEEAQYQPEQPQQVGPFGSSPIIDISRRSGGM